jgi:hypothetical protein
LGFPAADVPLFQQLPTSADRSLDLRQISDPDAKPPIDLIKAGDQQRASMTVVAIRFWKPKPSVPGMAASHHALTNHSAAKP